MQSSDFEKNIIFIFPRVENVENPLYFRMWALPEELAPVNCKKVENFENPLHFRSRVFPEELSQGKSQNVVWNSIQAENITFDSELGFRKEAYFHLTEGGKRFKIHFIFRSELSLKRVNPRHISKLEQNSIQLENITFDAELGFREEYHFHIPRSSVFEKNIIFISPRVENVENPLYFWIWALPEELAPVNCKNNSIQPEIITFDRELGFRKKLIFMLPRVENVENPLYFRIWALPEEPQSIVKMVENVENPFSIRIWALPEELTQSISQNVGVENVENPLYFRIWALPEELAPVNCKNKAIQPENITFDSELGFRKEAYFHVPQVGNHSKSTSFSGRAFRVVLAGISQNVGVENVENPLYFRIWALPEELAPVNCKRWKTLKIHFIFDPGFPEELSQGKSQNVVWNSIQAENITFDSELGFEKAYFHLTEGGKRFKIHFIFRSELSLKS
ncbi:hypothetical protein E2320_000127 [Naja naja]|nr:hypothetical protein E2320_000127 [Naja naja]